MYRLIKEEREEVNAVIAKLKTANESLSLL